MRRLLLLVGAIVLVDMAFYSAIVPLLPAYEHRFGISKAAAGLLAGSYAAGTLLAALPSGWIAARVGARRVVVAGMVVTAAATLGFAFARSVPALDATRFLQGLGGSFTWTGALGWLLACTPAPQRGRTIGIALSAALAGLLLGPVLGTLAREAGAEAPFSAVAAVGAALVVAALAQPAPPRSVGGQRLLATALANARIRTGMALVAVLAGVFGALNLLSPLQLDRLGAGGVAIGATFVIAAAIEGVAQVAIGHVADRRGRALPLRIGFAVAAGAMLLLPLAHAAWVFAVLLIVASVMCGSLNTPAIALVSDGVEHAGGDQAFGFALVNLTWAAGQLLGALAGGAVAQATGLTTPFLLLGAICAAALIGIARAARRAPAAGQAA
ncbi:MAG TPA: MFS transporter [Conexibacter sp.]|nr:MFS transporter [Conexibacter sp.]